jgi:hypothetical protein
MFWKSWNRKRSIVLIVSCWMAASAVGAQQASRVKINGKLSADPPLTVKGKTYVSVDALKAAGARVQVSGGVMEVTLGAGSSVQGGTNQQAGVEGKAGEWLFNGIWRFRVISLTKADPAKQGAGWLAQVEIRNGSKFNGYSPGGTGWEGLSIVLEDGASIGAVSDAVDLSSKGLAIGASNTQTIYFETESVSKPVKLILRLNPKGLEGTPAGLRYTVPDPSFRVDIKDAVIG